MNFSLALTRSQCVALKDLSQGWTGSQGQSHFAALFLELGLQVAMLLSLHGPCSEAFEKGSEYTHVWYCTSLQERLVASKE